MSGSAEEAERKDPDIDHCADGFAQKDLGTVGLAVVHTVRHGDHGHSDSHHWSSDNSDGVEAVVGAVVEQGHFLAMLLDHSCYHIDAVSEVEAAATAGDSHCGP